jgi:hypothetical protein
MFGLGYIFSIFSSSSNDFEEEIDEDSFYEESEIDIQSSVCSIHERSIHAQTGDVIHSSDVEKV